MTHHVNGGRLGRQARSRAQGSIGVPPVFPIGVQDDDQKLAGRTLPRSRSPICSRHSATQARRLCYHRLGLMPPLRPFGESSLLGTSKLQSPGTSCLAQPGTKCLGIDAERPPGDGRSHCQSHGCFFFHKMKLPMPDGLSAASFNHSASLQARLYADTPIRRHRVLCGCGYAALWPSVRVLCLLLRLREWLGQNPLRRVDRQVHRKRRSVA